MERYNSPPLVFLFLPVPPVRPVPYLLKVASAEVALVKGLANPTRHLSAWPMASAKS